MLVYDLRKEVQMYQVKIFCEPKPSDLEKKVNEWLAQKEQSPEFIQIIQITKVVDGGDGTLTILYLKK